MQNLRPIERSTMEIAGPRGTREEVMLTGILKSGRFLVTDSAGELRVVDPQDVVSWTTTFEVQR